MKRAILSMLLILPASCIVDPGMSDVEQATPEALNPAECRQRAASAYNECVTDCNQSAQGADGTKTQCLNNADQSLRNYFQGLSQRLTPELLRQGPNGDIEGLIQEEITKWSDARWECEDTFNNTNTERYTCNGACDGERATTYSGCIGTCDGGVAAGSACVPQSNRVPGWAECGILNAVRYGSREGQCDCYSDEGRIWFGDGGSKCSKVLDMMRDSRYGTACGNQAGFRWTPQVSKTAEGAPSDVRMRCVPWSGNRPDFSQAFDPQEGR